MKIGIVGSREYENKLKIKEFIYQLKEKFGDELVIVSGGQKVVEEIENDLGSSIDIVVNNAGITRDKFFHKMAPEDWSAVINTNLNSMFNKIGRASCRERV